MADRDARDEVEKTYQRELKKLHAEFDGEDQQEEDEIDLTDEFTRAAGRERLDDHGGDGDDRGPAPSSGSKIRRRRKRKRDLGRGR